MCSRRGYHKGADNEKLMAEDGSAVLDMGDAQMSGGPCGEKCGIRILGQIQGMPRWADDPVLRRNMWCWRTGQEAESP